MTYKITRENMSVPCMKRVADAVRAYLEETGDKYPSPATFKKFWANGLGDLVTQIIEAYYKEAGSIEIAIEALDVLGIYLRN